MAEAAQREQAEEQRRVAAAQRAAEQREAEAQRLAAQRQAAEAQRLAAQQREEEARRQARAQPAVALRGTTWVSTGTDGLAGAVMRHGGNLHVQTIDFGNGNFRLTDDIVLGGVAMRDSESGTFTVTGAEVTLNKSNGTVFGIVIGNSMQIGHRTFRRN